MACGAADGWLCCGWRAAILFHAEGLTQCRWYRGQSLLLVLLKHCVSRTATHYHNKSVFFSALFTWILRR